MAMWADTLFSAERSGLLLLLTWAAMSVLAGTALGAWLRGDRQSVLLAAFAIQTAGWGATELVVGALAYRTLAMRDLAAATRLDRLLWLGTGLAIGCVMTGFALAAAGWWLGRRLRLVGTGIGVVVQGCALALLALRLASQISR
jgi:hypothetical protein